MLAWIRRSPPFHKTSKDFGNITYSEAGHVREEDGGLDDLLDGGTGLREDSLEVLDAEGSLLGDSSVLQHALGVEVDLAGAVDGASGLDGLGLNGWYTPLVRLHVPDAVPLTRDLRRGRQLHREGQVRRSHFRLSGKRGGTYPAGRSW